jgi:hypothetical protein
MEDRLSGGRARMSTPRERILASRAHRSSPIELAVPEWGETVWIRVLSARDQAAMADDGDRGAMPVRILIKALIDADGAPIFSDADLEELLDEQFPVIFRVFSAVAKANGLTTKELDEAIAKFQGRAGAPADLPDGAGAGEDGGVDRGEHELSGAHGVDRV